MRKIATFVFVIYLVILMKIIVFKGSLFFRIVPTNRYYREHTTSSTYTEYNIVPFRSIRYFLFEEVSASAAFFNLAGNIMLFFPFGFLLPVVFASANKLSRVLLATIALSISFELYQLFSHTGQCDTDDVILNIAGGILGFMINNIM
jgi:glycopeptide antibiotics resistance protein